jgi:hypothetical protein
MAPRLLEARAMRNLGLLVAAALLVSSPALARKHQKHSAPPPAHAVAPEPAPVAAEPARPEPPPRAALISQSDDDEVPGKKHKK